MKRFACAFLFVSLVGCGKKAAPAPTVAEQVQQPPPTAAAPVAAPAAAVPEPTPTAARVTTPKPVSIEDQLQGTVHPEMTMRLQMFYQMKGRLPENFYELQNMGGFDSTPGLPPGMMYVIDPKDRTVKITRK